MIYKLFFYVIFFLLPAKIFCLDILIYDDIGASTLCVEQTIQSIKSQVLDKYNVKTINATDLLDGNWTNNTSVIILPGGIATYYAEKLNGKGNNIIKNFVQNGGSYLGLCAGGYYAGAKVDFASGSINALLKSHELAFFAGTVIGPALKEYDYNSNSGECIANISINKNDHEGEKIYQLYYNGGGYFENAEHINNVNIIGLYESLNDKPAAIIHVKVGAGNSILSGVHFEYNSSFVKAIDEQYDYDTVEAQRRKLLRDVLTTLNLELKP